MFEEPWQGRALGMGVVALERSGAPVERSSAATWRRRSRPIPGTEGESAATAYYACWLDALEALLAERRAL